MEILALLTLYLWIITPSPALSLPYLMWSKHYQSNHVPLGSLPTPRWWFEQIGFWGAPGTAPPDEESPIGILAINVPAESSPEAYREKYPEGFKAPYTASSSSGGATTAGNVGMSTLVLTVVIFLLGICIGGGLTMLMVKNRGAYAPLN
jgi:hypothetical protein